MQCYKIFILCKWVKILFYNIITPRGEYFVAGVNISVIFSPRGGDIMGVKIISYTGSYLVDPTSPIPSNCASIVATSTLRVNL